MYNNCDQLKCWIRQGKPASKALLEHCEETAEQVTANSSLEKRCSACLVLLDTVPGDLQRSFPASGILWLCDIFVGKKFFMLFCFIEQCSPTCSIVLFFNHLLPLFSLLSLFLLLFCFVYLLFSLSHICILLQHLFNNSYAVTYSVYSCSLLKKTLPSLLLRIKKAQLTPLLCL